MNIASVSGREKGSTDRLLSEVAKRLQDEGVKVCGIVQNNVEREDRGPCDMELAVLPSGQTIQISQDLGRHSSGCRLNPTALEEAAVEVEKALMGDVDILIVNKFGQREAEGGGFRSVIGDALAKDVPVLAGVSHANGEEFSKFADGLSISLDDNVDAILDWCRRVMSAKAA